MRAVPSQMFASVRSDPRIARALAPLGFVALAVLMQLPLYARSAVPLDEGHLAAAASRLLAGELLYRDIHTGIFPGVYYFAALLFEIFGRDLVVARWAQVGINAAVAVLLWQLGTRVARPGWAVLPPLLYLSIVAFSFPVLTLLNYSSLALFTGLATLVWLLRYLSSGRRLDAAGIGGFLAATALTKQNFGALVLVAVLLGLAAGRRDSPLRERSWFRMLTPVAATGGLLTALAVAYFIATGTLGILIDEAMLRIFEPQLQAFNDPIPPLFGPHPENDSRFVFIYSPPALFGYLARGETILAHPISPALRGLAIRFSYGLPLFLLAISPLLLWSTRSGDSPGVRRDTRAIVIFAVVFFLGIFPSAIWSHLAFVLAPVLLLLALTVDRLDIRLRDLGAWPARVWRGALAAVTALCLLAASRTANDVRRWFPVPIDVPHATLYVSADQAALYRRANGFIDACAGPDETIFVAPDLPILYFVTGRRNPTRFDLTIPGNVDGPTIIEQLEASGTNCIVFNSQMYLQFAPFEELFPELSHYLHTSFERRALMQAGGMEWQGLVRRRRAMP